MAESSTFRGNVFVIGHSFVRGLNQDMYEQQWDPDFKLTGKRVTLVEEYAEGQISCIRDVLGFCHFLQCLIKSGIEPVPAGAILHIGENDIDQVHFNATEFTQGVSDILSALREVGIIRVVVCSVLPRQSPFSESYECHRVSVNALLQDLIINSDHSHNTYFYKFQKQFCTKLTKHTGDGVHVPTEVKKYYYLEMRRAIMKLDFLPRQLK